MDGAQVALLERAGQPGVVVPAVVREGIEAQEAGRDVRAAVGAVVVVLVAGPKDVVDRVRPVLGGLPLGVGGVGAQDRLVERVARVQGAVQDDGRGPEPLRAQRLALEGARTSRHQHGAVGITLVDVTGGRARGAEPRQLAFAFAFASVGVEIGVVGRAVRLGAEERVVGRGEDDFQEGIGRAAGPHGRVAPERGLARQQGEALPGGGRRNVDGSRGEDGQRGSDRPQEQQEEAHRFPGGGVGGSHYSLRRDAATGTPD
mmetsp:Transcript_20289/g.47896  ORF Transcript_20289/g.47896 Transcript_20289/m.47896 type:complete len:259 (-) Transcript_20289:79-855(-)